MAEAPNLTAVIYQGKYLTFGDVSFYIFNCFLKMQFNSILNDLI